ncbi:hypothetical protein GW17_00008197 [Ensete ventricosum]|nr:hypothetical protein GW17_00008197 [Ensete ventricosum]
MITNADSGKNSLQLKVTIREVKWKIWARRERKKSIVKRGTGGGREEGAHVGLEEGDVVLVKRARILLVDLVLGLGSHGTLLSSRSLSLSLSVRLVLRYKSAAAPPAARHSPKYKGTADKRKRLVKYRPSDGQRTVDSSSLGRSPPYIAR